jgi:aspartate/methionine/tyrosine aminotransferase
VLSLLLFHVYLVSICSYKPGVNVWASFSDLAIRSGGVNLGQGYPDWEPPQFVLDSLRTVSNAAHQYSRSAGHPKLVEVLAKRYSNHLERDIHPLTEIAVTVGKLRYTIHLFHIFILLLHRCVSSIIFNSYHSVETWR